MNVPSLRRGLPREPGGEPWPPEGATPPAATPPGAAVPSAKPPVATPPVATPPVASPPAATAPGAASLRQGLPRTPGGEPFPPAAVAPGAAAPVATPPVAAPPAAAAPGGATVDQPLRQGLPRTPGGAPFPPVATAPVAAPPSATPPAATPPAAVPPAAPGVAAPVAAPPAATPPVAAQEVKKAERPAEPATAEPAVEKPAWLGKAIAGGIAALVLLVAGVFVSRGIIAGSDFTERYTGVAPMPSNAPVGLPAWLGWSHFFNMFLMVLIIRTGLQIRGERKPPAYFTSRRTGKKVSLTIWFHTSLDLLWLLNGLVFYVLLFTTGQWMRIVPTSWDIFPNMASAGLQYLSLNWPTENGWIHYNALQQMAYFITVFIAAPLAAITGYRMSTWWPKDWKFFPVQIARKLHMPVMLYFVLFIIVHVFLVFTTGMMKNLGHMFAATPDGGWLGLVLFLVSVLVTAGAAFAARPLVLAVLARPFGEVTNR